MDKTIYFRFWDYPQRQAQVCRLNGEQTVDDLRSLVVRGVNDPLNRNEKWDPVNTEIWHVCISASLSRYFCTSDTLLLSWTIATSMVSTMTTSGENSKRNIGKR